MPTEAETLYNEAFMDHVSHPDYKYQLERPTHTHAGVNPTCGDSLEFSVRLADDGTVEEAAFTGSGCAISQASADMMADAIIGRTPEEATALCRLFCRMVRGEVSDEEELAPLGEAALLRDIAHMPARVRCAELAWHTLEEMLANASPAAAQAIGND